MNSPKSRGKNKLCLSNVHSRYYTDRKIESCSSLKKEIMKTVLIKDENGENTVGKVDVAEVGNVVTVSLRDENGMPIEATGEVVEILDED